MSRSRLSTAARKKKVARQKLKQKPARLTIVIPPTHLQAKKRWARKRQRKWVERIKVQADGGPSKEEIRVKKMWDALASKRISYKREHLLGLPIEVRQKILLAVIPDDVLAGLPPLVLRNFCAHLATTHSIIHDDIPYVYKQLEKKRIDLHYSRQPKRIMTQSILNDLMGPLVAAKLPQKVNQVVKLKERRKARSQRCWGCGFRHYNISTMCKPANVDDDMGGWGQSNKLFAEYQLERANLMKFDD
jgi:hypothetical protein